MLIFYDYEFNLLAAETNVISGSWEIYYNDVGSFEAHLPLSSEIVKLLPKHRYIVVRDGTRCAVLVGYQLSDELAIYGRTCNWLLEKRIAAPAEYSGYAAELARGVVQTAFPNSEITVQPGILGSPVTFKQSSNATALEVVSGILAQDNLGHSLDFDYADKCWKFRILQGMQRPLLISEANKNAWELSLTEDILDLATCCVYDEGSYDSGKKTGIYRWQTMTAATTEQEAKEQLSKCRAKSEMTLKLRGLTFGTDYDVGDTVRVQTIKGPLRRTEKRRIKGVYMEISGGTVKPIFENITEE